MIAISAMTLSFSVAPEQVAAQNVTDVVLGSGSFQIPFNIAKNGSQPREIQLYMASADNVGELGANPSRSDPASRQGSGGQWRLLDRQPPGVGQFQVSETPEGTFWFATRTIDASGRAHPPGPIQPELKVTIDTSEPVVRLAAEASAEGRVIAEFTVEDASGADQMTVHYFTDSRPQWQTASISRTARGGRFSIEPTEDWQQLSLRVRVLDRAGNETIVKQSVQKPRIANSGSTRLASGPMGLHDRPSASVPYTSTITSAAKTAFPAAPYQTNSDALPPPSSAAQLSEDFGMPSFEIQSTDLQANRKPDANPNRSPEIESLPSPAPEKESRPQTPTEAMRPLPSNDPFPMRAEPRDDSQLVQPLKATEPVPETSFQTEIVPAPNGTPPVPTQLNRPAINTERLDASDVDTSELGSETEKQAAAPSPWSPIDPNRNQNPRRSFSRESPSPSPSQNSVPDQPQVTRRANDQLDLENLAKRSVIRYSDSRQFSLDYEIEAIGGRGVEAIELYGTTDGGQSWKRWGDDPDRVSPFDIETNGEGIFGFQIVVVAANGLASARPLPGDVPDIVVVVDETLPEVSISGARYGESDRAGSLVIQYRCSDTYLVSRPITIAFSDSPDGPWTTIAAGLRNLGDYVWPADPQLPRQIYLRIDATDQAGNVGGFVLEEPIDTRGLAPRARIRAFRSIPTR